MCYLILRQVLIVVVLFTAKGNSLAKFVDLTRITCYACKFPQPRSIILAQEIQLLEDTVPYMATLHRCDEGSGCCTVRGFVCKVARWEVLNATVYVKDSRTKRYLVQHFELRNHTECSCQISTDTPK